ncbi:MAG: PfkB family carbohydrate kinase, partial [Lachnospiraceae bacterium]|nr:PfkB family carbohydrate kinase [Lachnospiraceae bacterium]
MSDTMNHKILCFGSLNIDHVYSVDHFVAKGETLSSQKLETFTGGKGLNQSVALARAGAETYHAGAIGPDGSFLLDMMKEAGVHTDYVTMIPDAHTGHAIIQRDKEGDNCILLYGGTNQLITKEQADSVLNHFSAGDYLVLQNEINQLPYIVEKAHALGMTIVLNPSPMNEKVLQLPLDDLRRLLGILHDLLVGHADVDERAGVGAGIVLLAEAQGLVQLARAVAHEREEPLPPGRKGLLKALDRRSL